MSTQMLSSCANKAECHIDFLIPNLRQAVAEIPWSHNLIIEYRLTRELPPELQGKLPQPEELEEEIRQELLQES